MSMKMAGRMTMFGKKKVDDGPAPHQEEAPTGELHPDHEAPEVAQIGEFNQQVADHAHVMKQGIRKTGSMVVDASMVPKQDKWSDHAKEHGETLAHLNEPEEELTPLEALKWKVMLYTSMGKLQGEIVFTRYLIKMKKRQFGVDVYNGMDEDGRVGESTLKFFEEYKESIQKLEDSIKWNQNELLKLGLTGQGETVIKPRSPRA